MYLNANWTTFVHVFLRLVNYYDSARANPCWLYSIILFLFLFLFLFLLLLLLVKSHSIPFFPPYTNIKNYQETSTDQTSTDQDSGHSVSVPGRWEAWHKVKKWSDAAATRRIAVGDGGSFGWGWHKMAMFGGIPIGSNRFGDWLLRLWSPFLF